MAAVGIELSDEATADLKSIVDFLWEKSPGAAREFGESFKRAIERIRDFPEAAPRVEPDGRRLVISRQPYAIVYVVTGSMAKVVAVAHTSRDASTWRSRLN